eukprot:scaffold567_cov127-Isochrysis_galbana.AAC.7
MQEATTGNEKAGGTQESSGRFDQTQHFLLVFTQKTNGQPFIRIDTKKANWEVFANAAQAGLEPINPMCTSSAPTLNHARLTGRVGLNEFVRMRRSSKTLGGIETKGRRGTYVASVTPRTITDYN